MTVRGNDEEAADFYADPANRELRAEAHQIERPRLSTHVPIRFRPDTIAAVSRLADEDGTTVSGWIRNVVELAVRRRTPAAEQTFSAATGDDQSRFNRHESASGKELATTNAAASTQP